MALRGALHMSTNNFFFFSALFCFCFVLFVVVVDLISFTRFACLYSHCFLHRLNV